MTIFYKINCDSCSNSSGELSIPESGFIQIEKNGIVKNFCSWKCVIEFSEEENGN